MNKTLQKSLLFFALVAALTGCRKKIYEDFYGRPDSLANPIYQVLTERGNFKNLLALIDKSGYRETFFTGAGYWTLFAANDDAFNLYFKDRGIGGIADIDSATARAILQYCLVFNSFEKNRLDDYQATANNAGWTPSIAFRRRTAYYTGFYKDTGAGNAAFTAIANNRNNVSGSLTGNYVPDEDNNKYITYFTDDYFNNAGLTAADYNYFFPSSEYKGFNIGPAKVVRKDIPAENGVIHEMDRVITPLMSIDEYIRTRPEYSSFRAILNRLYANNTIQFIYNATATHRYQVLTGKTDSVYVKAFSSALAFSPNNENFLKAEANDGQKDCWTMFVPNNAAVDAFVKNVLCQYYPSLDQMPLDVIADFLNSHLFPTAVWPTRFTTTRNKLTEPARFDPTADVFDRKILSNGFLYGTTKVQAADVFSTVYSKAYLNPNYTMMTRLFNVTGIRLLIAKSNVPVNIFLVPDQVFAAAGYSYNVTKDVYEYKGSTNGVYDKLTRIAATCVFFEPFKTQVDNLSGADIVKSGDAGTEGDYIRFNNNTITTGGLQDAGKTALVDSVKTATNGKVYFLNDIPIYSEKPVGTHVKNLGLATTSDYNYFWQYLSNSLSMYNATSTDIIGLTGFNTLFAPKNSAMLQAVNDGLLPGTGTAPNKVPNFNPSDEPNRALVRKFLQYHILSSHTIIPDGNLSGSLETYLKNPLGNAVKVFVTNNKGSMAITDSYNRTANVIVPQSNNLSSRCMIHLLDNYLKYNDN